MNLYIYRYLETNEFTATTWKNVVIDKERGIIINRSCYSDKKIFYNFEEFKAINNLNEMNIIKSNSVRVIFTEYISLKPVKNIDSLLMKLKKPIELQQNEIDERKEKSIKTKKELKELNKNIKSNKLSKDIKNKQWKSLKHE